MRDPPRTARPLPGGPITVRPGMPAPLDLHQANGKRAAGGFRHPYR
ncbi:hypothetical protein BSIN_3109 [Burkholderia singularis]|uniref:Uncharacterized protein n=1 Tax=Burkholderia singularis TaxID=1503053 RepID=A0A238H3M2_9BURK|nr:hypothetical protein BSIN_3109 [Burkholderia singularis]